MARQIGPRVETRLLHDSDPAATLRTAAADRDLLVVATHRGSRVGGILLGRTATALIHTPAMPTLLARRPPAGAEFPLEVVLASDGSAASERAIGLAIRIGRAYGSKLTLVVARWGMGNRDCDAIIEDGERRLAAGGLGVVTVAPVMDPCAAIVETAMETRASVVIVGSHRRAGLRALGSVSESVAHRAPCSVLVAG